METTVAAPFEIANEDICPEGWRLYKGGPTGPCPVLFYMGKNYVPKSRALREWKGTIYELAEAMGPNDPNNWGDGVIVEVKEVRA